MKYPVFILTLFSLFAANAQISISGRVLEDLTENGIPYVNIGIIEEGIGGMTDESGHFNLTIPSDLMTSDSNLIFSALGFELKDIPLNIITSSMNNTVNVYLKASPMLLREVIVSNRQGKVVNETLGSTNTENSQLYYWKGNLGLGAELATKIISNGERTLTDLRFRIDGIQSDWVKIRINVYDGECVGGLPCENANKSNKAPIVVINKDTKRVSVDLEPYKIVVNDNFSISLELVEIPENSELGVILPVSYMKSEAFRKYRSFGKWERIAEETIAIEVDTEIYLPTKKAEKIENRQNKQYAKSNPWREPMMSGFIFFEKLKAPNVKVTNLSNGEKAISDSGGRYQIKALEGDKLLFELNEGTTQEKFVGNKKFLNVRF